jgi:NitT/TauT family transport system substrate-binding protein
MIKSLRHPPWQQGTPRLALDAGTIDGFLMPHPNPAIVDMDGQGKYVVALGRMWPDHACCSVLVSGTLIRDRPDLVKKSAKIHTRATNYINHHSEEAARIYSNRTGHYVELVKYAIITWDVRWISNLSLQAPSAVDFNLNCTDRVLTEEDLFDVSFYDGFA